MKKYLYVLVAVVMSLVGCSEQQFVVEALPSETNLDAGSEFKILIEKARWGDGQAYLELADCYRDGKGVEKDFVNMLSMAVQAEEYGGIRRMENYLKELPEGSEFRLIIDAIDEFEKEHVDVAMSLSEQLIANGSLDGYTVQGIIAIEKGDTLNGVHMLEQAASQGSTFARFLLCVPEGIEGKEPDMERLKSLSEKNPFVNAFLAKIYMGEDDESTINDSLVAHYYLKADENACLSKQGARWLLGYHNCVNKHLLSGRDIQRLKILADESKEERQETNNYIDDISEEAVEVTDSVVIE